MLFEFAYNVNTNKEGDAPIALAMCLTGIIVLTLNISGGHLNPAVTVAVFIEEGS